MYLERPGPSFGRSGKNLSHRIASHRIVERRAARPPTNACDGRMHSKHVIRTAARIKSASGVSGGALSLGCAGLNACNSWLARVRARMGCRAGRQAAEVKNDLPRFPGARRGQRLAEQRRAGDRSPVAIRGQSAAQRDDRAQRSERRHRARRLVTHSSRPARVFCCCLASHNTRIRQPPAPRRLGNGFHFVYQRAP